MNNSSPVLSISLQKMHNGNHLSFMGNVLLLFDTELFTNKGFSTLINELKVATEAENKSMTVPQKSIYTEELVKINLKREEVYASLYFYYESCIRHYQTEIKQAAKQLSPVMLNIATIHNCSNLKRKAQIEKICYNMQRKFRDEMMALNMQGWVEELNALNAAYGELDEQRLTKKTSNGSGNTGKMRVATDAAYRKLVERLNALLVLEGTNEYKKTISMLNVHIKAEKKSIAIREGMRKGRKARLLATKATSEPTDDETKTVS